MAAYLVTGGAGFIGSHLCDALLSAGHRVTVLDDLSTGKRDNVPAAVTLLVGDVADPLLVTQAMAGADGCFHLAAIASVQRSNDDWVGTHRVNQGGAITVFQAAAAAGGIPVVYASSAAVYGDNPALPLMETADPRPLSAYGADKLGCELHARVAALVHGVPTIGFRFFNIFGPRQDPLSPYSGVISIFIDRLRRGQPLLLFGDGEQSRDFVYVGDVVRHLLAAMAQAGSGAQLFNLCSGRATSLRQLIALLGDLLAVTPVVQRHPPRAGDIRASLGSPLRCQRSLGLAVSTSLADGLAALLAAS